MHFFDSDHELVEIFSEKETNEKEKEIEKEKEQIKTYDSQNEKDAFDSRISNYLLEYFTSIGRFHNEDSTPPPEELL